LNVSEWKFTPTVEEDSGLVSRQKPKSEHEKGVVVYEDGEPALRHRGFDSTVE
jgi:hypothetical protein